MAIDDSGAALQGLEDRRVILAITRTSRMSAWSTSPAAVDRHRQAGCRHGCAKLGVALAISNLVKEKNAILLNQAAASADLTGKACNANTDLHHLLPRHLHARQRLRQGADQGRRRQLVLRLADYAFRRGDAAGADQAARSSRPAAARCSVTAIASPPNTSDFCPACCQAQSSKAKVIGFAQCRRRHHQRDKQAAEFGIVAGGQSSPRCCCSSTTCIARLEDRTGPDLPRVVPTGPQRQDPRLVGKVPGKGRNKAQPV